MDTEAFHPFVKSNGITGKYWLFVDGGLHARDFRMAEAIMISQSEEGKLSREDADLLNHHIAVSHSQLEDPLLFVAVGYPIAILVIPRILLSNRLCVGQTIRALAEVPDN